MTDEGFTWVLVRRAWGPRAVIRDPLGRQLLELADGTRTPDVLATALGRQVGARVSTRQVTELLEPLIAAGMILDGEDPSDGGSVPARGLVVVPIDDRMKAAMRVSVLPGTGFDCDGRGGCCRLYDRIALRPGDIANLERAYPDGYLPGGLTLTSAIHHDGSDEPDVFSMAVVNGACAVLEEGGLCGVHRLLGLEKKPTGCASYPFQEVVCEDDLAVGLAAECRCIIDFAGGPSIEPAAQGRWVRAQGVGRVEAVAGWVPMTAQRVAPRAEYVAWRAAARARLEGEPDPVAWAFAEAAALAGGEAVQGTQVLRRLLPLLQELVEFLDFEAQDLAKVYPSVDLQRGLVGWAAPTAARLLEAVREGREPGRPQSGERLVAGQTLHTHALLRSRSVSQGLVALGLRLAMARAAAEGIPAELLPVSAFELLGRASVFGLLVERAESAIAAALNPP